MGPKLPVGFSAPSRREPSRASGSWPRPSVCVSRCQMLATHFPSQGCTGCPFLGADAVYPVLAVSPGGPSDSGQGGLKALLKPGINPCLRFTTREEMQIKFGKRPAKIRGHWRAMSSGSASRQG